MQRVLNRILESLLSSSKSYWELLKESECDGPSFMKSFEELIEDDLIEERESKIYLTDKGRKVALNLKPRWDLTCPTCNGHTVVAKGPFANLPRKFKEISQKRPMPVSLYDQGYILPEDTIARVLYLYQRGDLTGSLFFLGDDDLTSVACALTGLPLMIEVLEIDQRLNQFLRGVAKSEGWDNFEVLDYDARQPIPSSLQGQFDVFFTDPVETLQGITLFLSRCASALKGEGSAGYFGFTRIECPLSKWHQVESRLLEMNFAITDIVRNFHEYYLEPLGIAEKGYRITTNAPIDVGAPNINFFLSNLVRLELIGSPHPLITDVVSLGRELYYDEEMWVTLPESNL